MEHRPYRSTRRSALMRIAALAAAPLAGAACRRRTAPAAAPAAADRPAPPGRLIPLPSAEPEVRVRLGRIDANGVFAVGARGRPLTVTGAADLEFTGPLEVRRSINGWRLASGRHIEVVDSPEPIAVRQASGDPIAAGGATYPGWLRFVPSGDPPVGFDAINHVPLEAYLPGVLEGELYGHWHDETFAAQAIAARSFACAEMWTFRRRHYDVVSGPASQAYVGVSTLERAVAAAELTRGLVLAWRGALVPGYYSSTCGGSSSRACDVIGSNPVNAVPPLDGRGAGDACTNAPLYRWTSQRSRSDVVARLRAWGKRTARDALEAIDGLRSIRVVAVSTHGRPLLYGIEDERGARVTLEADSLRRALDLAIDGAEPAKPLYSSDLKVTIERDVVTLEGRGYGHGAGLCQYGAEALARRGSRSAAIIEWYYPGVEIVRAYGA